VAEEISDQPNNDLNDQFNEQSAPTDSLAFVAWPRSTPIIAACLMATAALVGVWILERNSASQYLDEVRADTVRDLAAVRGAAEIAINRRIHLTLGLRAYVSINPDINEHEFADFAALLMKEADGIRSVTSIKDNVINDVYPREGNEGAIGLELLKNPNQRVAAEYAIETGRPWPVQTGPGRRSLYQSSSGLCHRSRGATRRWPVLGNGFDSGRQADIVR
jgi:hypothetical protein